MQSNLIRTSQPQEGIVINWNNPITRGLADVILPARLHSARGIPATTTGTDRGFSAYSQGYGRAFNGGSSTTRDVYPGAWSRVGTLFTFLTVYRLRSIPAGGTRIAGNWANLNNGFALVPNSTNFAALFADWQFGGANANLIGSAVSTMPKADIVMYDGGQGLLYENGVLTASNGYPYTAPTGDFFIGSDISGTGPTADSIVSLTALWRRNLSIAEIRSISSNPWQLFQPQKRNLWAAPVPSVKMTPVPAKGPSIITKRNTYGTYDNIGFSQFTSNQRGKPSPNTERLERYWVDRGIRSIYIADGGRWRINRVNGLSLATTVGTNPIVPPSKLVITPGVAGEGITLPLGLDNTRPFTLFVESHGVFGTVNWSYCDTTVSNRTGWLLVTNTGLYSSINAVDGIVSSLVPNKLVFTHTANNDLIVVDTA